MRKGGGGYHRRTDRGNIRKQCTVPTAHRLLSHSARQRPPLRKAEQTPPSAEQTELTLKISLTVPPAHVIHAAAQRNRAAEPQRNRQTDTERSRGTVKSRLLSLHMLHGSRPQSLGNEKG